VTIQPCSPPPPQQQLVICADTLVAGRHFPLDTDPHAIGWKSVAVNLSDIAAMGATPYSILLALSLPQIDHDWLKAFSQGLYDCCDQFGVSLIGGDTTQSPHLTLSVTALGWVDIGKAVPRSGAQSGDLICVSGTVGDAAFALQHLGHPLQKRLDYPTPRCALGAALKGLANSMIDVSDGLAQDLGHILKASQVGARLQLENLPISPALQALDDAQKWQYALAGGDDYELCFTISPQNYEKLLQKQLDVSISMIGTIQQQHGLTFEKNGVDHLLQFNGYQHFA
jgi:thiamine-monophosphate kinase